MEQWEGMTGDVRVLAKSELIKMYVVSNDGLGFAVKHKMPSQLFFGAETWDYSTGEGPYGDQLALHWNQHDS